MKYTSYNSVTLKIAGSCWASGGFLPAAAEEEMCRRDRLIGLNPQRRMVGARHHVGRERPERDSVQQQFDAVLHAIRGGNLWGSRSATINLS